MLDLTLAFLAIRLIFAQAFIVWVAVMAIKGILAFSRMWSKINWSKKGWSDSAQASVASCIITAMGLLWVAVFGALTWNNCVDIFHLTIAAFRMGVALG